VTHGENRKSAGMGSIRVERVGDAVGRCAELLVAALGGGARLVVTGGRGAAQVYERLAARRVDLADSELWLSDERCVPAGDARSNGRLVERQLVAPLPPALRPRLRAPRLDRPPAAAAAIYERELAIVGGSAYASPRFDVVFLSVGRDGHVASLFPDQAALGERDRWAVAVDEPGLAPFVPRVTLTFPVLAHCARLVLLALGEEKRPALAALEQSLSGAAGGRPDSATVDAQPAAMLASDCAEQGGEVVVVTDIASGGGTQA
jgi:6-phosphogluconolactonase